MLVVHSVHYVLGVLAIALACLKAPLFAIVTVCIVFDYAAPFTVYCVTNMAPLHLIYYHHSHSDIFSLVCFHSCQPLLQAGGHGTCIAQCQSAKIVTTRTIPMQVDGEPCRLLPSLIHLELRNKANLIAKTKSTTQHRQM